MGRVDWTGTWNRYLLQITRWTKYIKVWNSMGCQMLASVEWEGCRRESCLPCCLCHTLLQTSFGNWIQQLVTLELDHSDRFYVCAYLYFILTWNSNLGEKKFESRWRERSAGCLEQAIHVTATNVWAGWICTLSIMHPGPSVYTLVNLHIGCMLRTLFFFSLFFCLWIYWWARASWIHQMCCTNSWGISRYCRLWCTWWKFVSLKRKRSLV